MNVTKVAMGQDEAREQLRQVRRALHRKADDEYQALAAGLEALVECKPVISLRQAISAGGMDARGRPRLAVARSDRKQVGFVVDWRNSEVGMFLGNKTGRGRAPRNAELSVPLGRSLLNVPRGWALVPIVPPSVINKVGGLSVLPHLLTLWEVEVWADRQIGAAPDRDPYLLKPLGSDLYAVVAEWNLTDLERLIMAGRR